MAGMLESWNDGPTKSAITDFVGRVTEEGSPDYMEPAARVAVFDNDGTLWCEKPMPIQLDKTYDQLVLSFFGEAEHPTLGRPYRTCGYAPMVELLRYLDVNGFTNYIASGGDRDFMRPIAGDLYGIPPERVIGSALGLTYQTDGDQTSLVYKAAMDFFDDGPEKPIRIWSRIGRRPILAFGNSNGDIPMLAFSGTPAAPSLWLLLLHDDAGREFDYVTGAEQALELAGQQNWTVVSIKNDWNTVFADAT